MSQTSKSNAVPPGEDSTPSPAPSPKLFRVYINGRQCIACPLPDPSQRIPVTSVRAPAQRNLKLGKKLAGSEALFCLHISAIKPNVPNYPYDITAEISCDTVVVVMAPLMEMNGRAVVLNPEKIYNGGYPNTFTVSLCCTPKLLPSIITPKDYSSSIVQYTTTPEERLTAEILDLLRTDKYEGSHQSTAIQQLVANSTNYNPTMQNFGPSQGWHSYLSAHADVFYLFAYSAQEVKRYRFQHTCHSGELRIALNSGDMTRVFEEDVRRERTVSAAYEKVMHFINAMLLKHGEVDAQDMMKALTNECPEYQEFLKPSFTVFERIVRSDGRFHINEETKEVTIKK